MPWRRPLPTPASADDGNLLNAEALVRTGLLVTELRTLSSRLSRLADNLGGVRADEGPTRDDGAR